MTEVTQQLTRDNTNYNFYQRLITNFLSQIKFGGITLKDNNQELFFGDPQHKLQATISIQSDAAYSAIFWNGAIGLAEQYILDAINTDDLTTLLRIFALNLNVVNKVDRSVWGTVLRMITNCVHFINRNSISGSKKNIAKHYDLGNDFFKTFLDPTMMYSAAKFTSEDCTLEQASVNKLHMLCDKLQLTATDHLLEIGSGWGGLAIYAAKNYGCRVTTTTISKEQYDYAMQKVLAHGLQQQVTVLMQDYRELQGKYDKLVSVEMIEAVGHQYLGTYLQKCSDLLKPNGIFVLQAIVISEQNYVAAKNSVDFIKKYIFPGGFLPSIGEITKYLRSHTDINLTALEDLTLDYAKTLRVWRENFNYNKNKILSQGFDQIFFRKWLYYLCYCEAGFLERNIGVVQMILTKPNYRGNSYNDY
jgi:cyclopropane-fatty-acyl-phospholipid synthase